MASWKELSQECLDSARELYSAQRWRSSTSRAYYAIFSAVTWRLPAGAVQVNRPAPPHRTVTQLVDQYFGWLQWHQREALKAAVKRAYASRLLADYRPAAAVDRALAKQAIQDALGVLRRLGVDDGR